MHPLAGRAWAHRLVLPPDADVRWRVNTQPASETATWSNIGPVKHGYPPPRLSVGEVTTAYCGAELIVEGECSDRPPQDACAMCALAWENSKRPGRRWARAFGIGRASRSQDPE